MSHRRPECSILLLPFTPVPLITARFNYVLKNVSQIRDIQKRNRILRNMEWSIGLISCLFHFQSSTEDMCAAVQRLWHLGLLFYIIGRHFVVFLIFSFFLLYSTFFQHFFLYSFFLSFFRFPHVFIFFLDLPSYFSILKLILFSFFLSFFLSLFIY